MFARLDGSEVSLPYVDRLSPRFRLALFVKWAEHHPDRLHQIAAAYLMQNGFRGVHLKALREIPGVILSRPDDFHDEFDRIAADQPRGCLPNAVFNAISVQWIQDNRKRLDRQRLRAVAGLLLTENGFTTTQVADVLGWQARGSASRAMQNARDALAAMFDLN